MLGGRYWGGLSCCLISFMFEKWLCKNGTVGPCLAPLSQTYGLYRGKQYEEETRSAFCARLPEQLTAGGN